MSDPGDEHVERVLPAAAPVPGITGAADILARLEGNLALAQRSLELIKREIDERWERVHAINAEIRDLSQAIANAGGGFDADFYHRQRERSPSRRVRDGFMHLDEDIR